MQRNIIIIAGVLIAVLVVGALAVTTFTNQNPSTAASPGATKLSFQNNGTTWLHMDVILENVTLKNGTVQTFYNELWIKPNGTIVIDLSKLAGYGDTKLPAGTTLRILAWKGLFNNTTASNGELNLNMQGWSGTLQPGANDPITNVIFGGLKINQLPKDVTDNMIFTDTNIAKLHQQPGFIADYDEKDNAYEEEILTVDQNGRVTITIVKTPELCSLIAHEI
ncbi:MAG: hypothetical protein ACPK7O_05180 [Methanobacterium sp.]